MTIIYWLFCVVYEVLHSIRYILIFSRLELNQQMNEVFLLQEALHARMHV